jgi:vacuolar-type H+-ATPase subunit I/STV1
MKKWILLAALLGNSFLALQAQIKTDVLEETGSVSIGRAGSCLTMELPGTNKKQVIESWEDYIKEYKGKTKYNKKADEIFTDDATIKEISPNTIDIYAKVTETSNGTKLAVWFDVGLVFLSSQQFADKYPIAEKVVKNFAKTVSAELLEAEVKEQEKLLKNLEETLKKLEKEKGSKEKEIQEYRQTIKKAEDNIKKAEEEIRTNESEQGAKKKEIETQQKAVEDAKQRLKEVKGKKK